MSVAEYAEDYNPDDEFHRHMLNVCTRQSAGRLLGIFWNPSLNKPGQRAGVAIVMNGAELVSRRFTVEHTDFSYSLKFLGRNLVKESDYFKEQ
jgi:hypothetical protein